jgi:hypothetical protein
MHVFLCDDFFRTAQLLGSGFDGCGVRFVVADYGNIPSKTGYEKEGKK